MKTDHNKQDGRANATAAAPDDIVHPGSRTLFAYWDTLRGARPAPHRHEIELRSLAAILPWVGVVESDARNGHRWRLAGTGIARLWGSGLTGSSVAADWPDLARRAMLRAFDGVTGRQQPFVARLQAMSAHGEVLGLEFVALPVATEEGSIQALCALVPFRMPAWLGKVAFVDIEVRALRMLPSGPLPGEIASFRTGQHRSAQLRLIAGGRAD